MDIYSFLSQHSIAYARHDHPAVFTCEQAERLVPPMEAARTKNLFLRNRKGTRHFLVVVGYEKSADLKQLAPLLDVDKLSMGTPERMLEFLGVEPGSVTILALANDHQGKVEVVFDQPIAEASSLRCHPLVNTATLEVSAEDIRRFLQVTGHQLKVMDVPGRQELGPGIPQGGLTQCP
ncbi:prolyl-tRNA synthetase associated domain-containing protein [bacterium]|nr:prolyl-tRNA synthetase associated domain-containing protein [bacterium]